MVLFIFAQDNRNWFAGFRFTSSQLYLSSATNYKGTQIIQMKYLDCVYNFLFYFKLHLNINLCGGLY